MNILHSAIGQSNPQALSFLQQGARTGSDPFEKIKGMMEAMIKKLLNEAAEEAEHKKWCDEETAKTFHQKQKRENQKAELQSRIDEMTATIEGMQTKVEGLSSMLVDTAKSAEE